MPAFAATRPRMARLLGAAVAILGVVLLATGCAEKEDVYTDDGRLVIDYWEKWTGFEGEAMQAVVDAFNDSQDRIFVKKLTVSTIDQKMMLATAGGNPPDVAGLWSANIPIYSEKSALTPLDSLIESSGIGPDDYVPIFWDLCRHRGFTWGLPSTPASLALHWNKKLFRDAGLDPERPPRTIAELDRMAERLTVVSVERDGIRQKVRYTELTEDEKRNPDENFDIVVMGYSPSEPGWWNYAWGFWFGADLWDGERTITALDPGTVEAFHWFASYPRKYGVRNMRALGASFGNFSSPQNAFLSGKVAMVLQGVWMHNFIEKYNPQLEWGAAPFPSNDPDRLPLVTLAECDVLVIPRGAPHVEEAFEFIKYVNSQEPMERLCMGQRKFSPLAHVSDSFMRRHPNPYIRTFYDLARSPNARRAPPMTIWNEYADEFLIAADQIFDLKETPEEALGIVQERMQQRMDRVMRRWDLVKRERIANWKSP